MEKTYKKNRITKSGLKSVKLTEGMTMETRVKLFMNNQTDIERTSGLIYTERKEGVMAGLDIRTDRFEVAVDAMDKSSKSQFVKRQDKMTIVKDNEDGKADTIQGTDSK